MWNIPCEFKISTLPFALEGHHKSLLKDEKTPVAAILFFKMRPKIFPGKILWLCVMYDDWENLFVCLQKQKSQCYWVQYREPYVNLYFSNSHKYKRKLEIASWRSVSPEGTWLKRDVQNIMSNVTPPKDSGHMISYNLSSHPKSLRPIIGET